MKKVFVFILLILCFTGCTNNLIHTYNFDNAIVISKQISKFSKYRYTITDQDGIYIDFDSDKNFDVNDTLTVNKK